jgi:hypothetical protein
MLIQELNAPSRAERLEHLRAHYGANTDGIRDVVFSNEVNNHVHTFYSFSPYSPTAAAWMARAAGLQAVGSVDHDSISAAGETVSACAILGIGSTTGCELRVNFTGIPVEGRRINNPDSENLAYMVFHGVPARSVEKIDAFLAPIREVRNERNRLQTERMAEHLRAAGGPDVTFAEVRAASMADEGGSITERHILYAASRALMDFMQPGQPLRSFVEANLSGPLAGTIRTRLDDPTNAHYVYDLLGALKSSFLPEFFVQPTEAECIPVAEAVAVANEAGAIPAYAYLGDVGESPTGDKKAARFEDSYLDELVPLLKEIGFRAVTYMPPRNTKAQLLRVQELCRTHDLMEISGVDINSSRQVFTCPEILDPDFRHLIDATWALIAHEKLVEYGDDTSLFAASDRFGATLSERIQAFARMGRAMDPHNPESIRKAAGL